MKIHKVVLNSMRATLISLPVGAKIVHVDSQEDNLCFWYEFDESLTGSIQGNSSG